MSRQRWAEQARTNVTSDWRKAFRHSPLAGRTSDPEALAFDEAAEIFFNGVRCARRGDLEAARPQIATAFLLDSRSLNITPLLPDPDAADLAVDYLLLNELIMGDRNSFASSVLTIIAARHMGHDQREGQTFISEAMQQIEKLLKTIEQNPELEDPNSGILGGCLNRPELLFQRSGLHCSMGNRKLGIKDLSAALKINPSYTAARDARASLWASMKLKDHAAVHKEYTRIVAEFHEDHRGLEVAYAWLTMTTLEDASLGTLDDAKKYYKSCRRSQARRTELYGNKPKKEEPPIIGIVEAKYALMMSNIDARKFREDLDAKAKEGRLEEIKVPAGFVKLDAAKPDKSIRYECLNCGKNPVADGVSLKRCARCKQVSYCGGECQKADWKSHKVFCKQAVQKIEAVSVSKPTADMKSPGPAKTPISEENGHARACVRMQDELRKLFAEHGERFGDWWHEKNPKQKKDMLMDVTNNTIPQRKVPLEEITTQMAYKPSRCLFEYDVETLIGECGCSKDERCEHHHTDRLLHEIFTRAVRPECSGGYDYNMCKMMVDQSTFPNLFPGMLAIIKPQAGGGPERFDLEPMVYSPSAPKDVIDRTKNFIASGAVKEACPAFYELRRNVYALGLLVKIFDTYQEQVRRGLPEQPYERLMGCTSCKQTCEGTDTIKCNTCKVVYWCCSGCKDQDATAHGKKCPHGKPCDSKALFN